MVRTCHPICCKERLVCYVPSAAAQFAHGEILLAPLDRRPLDHRCMGEQRLRYAPNDRYHHHSRVTTICDGHTDQMEKHSLCVCAETMRLVAVNLHLSASAPLGSAAIASSTGKGSSRMNGAEVTMYACRLAIAPAAADGRQLKWL